MSLNAGHHAGCVLKHVRERIGISQLELALRLNISQRHVSFIEGGRSRPSRDLIENWSSATGAPASLRNAALHRAGFAPAVAGTPPAQAASVRQFETLRRAITLHEPFPGIVFDADWNARFANYTTAWLIRLLLPGCPAPERGAPRPFNLIDALIHEGGLLSAMRDPWQAGGALLDQIRREQWLHPALAARARDLEASMIRRFGPRPDGQPDLAGQPSQNLEFDTPLGPLRFVTLQTVCALPQDVTPASLRMELWFPADGPTRTLLRNKPKLKALARGEAAAPEGSAPVRARAAR